MIEAFTDALLKLDMFGSSGWDRFWVGVALSAAYILGGIGLSMYWGWWYINHDEKCKREGCALKEDGGITVVAVLFTILGFLFWPFHFLFRLIVVAPYVLYDKALTRVARISESKDRHIKWLEKDVERQKRIAEDLRRSKSVLKKTLGDKKHECNQQARQARRLRERLAQIEMLKTDNDALEMIQDEIARNASYGCDTQFGVYVEYKGIKDSYMFSGYTSGRDWAGASNNAVAMTGRPVHEIILVPKGNIPDIWKYCAANQHYYSKKTLEGWLKKSHVIQDDRPLRRSKPASEVRKWGVFEPCSLFDDTYRWKGIITATHYGQAHAEAKYTRRLDPGTVLMPFEKIPVWFLHDVDERGDKISGSLIRSWEA